jgi:hypothetical protein
MESTSSITARRSKGTDSISILPASIFERSRTSLIRDLAQHHKFLKTPISNTEFKACNHKTQSRKPSNHHNSAATSLSLSLSLSLWDKALLRRLVSSLTRVSCHWLEQSWHTQAAVGSVQSPSEGLSYLKPKETNVHDLEHILSKHVPSYFLWLYTQNHLDQNSLAEREEYTT